MRPTVRAFTGLTASLTAVVALIFGATSADNPRSADAVSHGVRPAAVITGEIPAAVIRNQFLYCSLICPYLIDGVTTVPIAAAGSPGVFAAAYETTGSVPSSIGLATHSVTEPAHAAMTGIVTTEQQAAAVDGINTASAVLFGAPELLLLGTTETANATAGVPATTGDIAAAAATGRAHAAHWVDRAATVIDQATD